MKKRGEFIMENSNEVILNLMKTIAENMPVVFDNKACILVTDKEKYIKVVKSSGLSLNVNEGEPITNDLKQIINSGTPTTKDINESSLKIPIRRYTLPIKNGHGEFIGSISISKSIDAKNKLLDLSSDLADTISNVSAAVEESTANIQTLSENNKDILVNVHKAIEHTKNSGSVLKFVQGVAKETNLLGINAAIEAARAGEAGKGFSVVAQHIRKLSNSTSDSIKEINEVLKNIEESVQQIADKIRNSNESFDTQAAALEEISASVQEVNNNAKTVEETARTL
ncbi:methyl-accepting chemotaxis protein [Clostridium acetobutylicum]|uniref:Methyl-accepting chemotaxis protein n=2 Tax=Clostridiaceae TaxID=31979 RepID=Q97M19_CLOAB|nr:Methyl-accepting chemotaxis protein [Clostridium acetobutylicum ATCC 824]AEI31209.1 methyl-accepting chemotaxis protein [Clostridium acetobutylicum DSM 1731]AWV80085.1 methyl-accepting chemotaxis protein [Clostridium acetobutylicum]PSM05887.1 methyl-accepting chemotaxis protein [Clostridium sp. NJ4]MBC2395907.1 methyl-accepting chemotaxis protein [Clostridium acetobutylicum]